MASRRAVRLAVSIYPHMEKHMANLPLLTTVPPVVQFNHVHNVAHDSDIPRECLMYQYPPDDKHDEYVDDEHDRIEYEHFLARLYIQRVRAMGLA